MRDRTTLLLLAALTALAVFGVGGLVVGGDAPADAGDDDGTTIPPFALATARPADPPASTTPITVALAGDVHGEDPIAQVLAEGANPLAGVADVLSAADLAVVNLETPVGHGGTPADKDYVFRADPSLVDALADAGVDVVTLANNHALDLGPEVAGRTRALVEDAGMAAVGYGQDATAAYAAHVVEVHGRTVAVLGLTRVMPVIEWGAGTDRPGMASAYDESAAVAAVRAAAQVADHVVVAIHWGRERWTCPDSVQLALADALVEAGADVVAGHHPHVLQGVTELDGSVVAYSLGNLAFYAETTATRQTGVLVVTLGPYGPVDRTWHPAVIDDRGRPQPVATQAPLPTSGEELRTVSSGPECGPPS